MADPLAVVIVAYRHYDVLATTVDAFAAQLHDGDRILVVDNTPGAHRTTEPEGHSGLPVEWLDGLDDRGRNSGPAGGFALGCAAAFDAGAAAVVLADQDFVPAEGCLDALRRTAAEHPTSLVTAVSVEPDGDGSRGLPGVPAWRRRGDELERGLLVNSHELARVGGWVLGEGPTQSTDAPARTSLASPHGLLVPAAVRSVIGDFDPRLFLGFEDYEYCLRAQEAGFDVVVAEQAQGAHHQSWGGHRRLGPLRLRVSSFDAARFAFGYRNTWWVAHRYLPAGLRRRWLLRETVAALSWLAFGDPPATQRWRAARLALTSGVLGRRRWTTSARRTAALEALRRD